MLRIREYANPSLHLLPFSSEPNKESSSHFHDNNHSIAEKNIKQDEDSKFTDLMFSRLMVPFLLGSSKANCSLR